jgi:hypothetical protein
MLPLGREVGRSQFPSRILGRLDRECGRGVHDCIWDRLVREHCWSNTCLIFTEATPLKQAPDKHPSTYSRSRRPKT